VREERGSSRHFYNSSERGRGIVQEICSGTNPALWNEKEIEEALGQDIVHPRSPVPLMYRLPPTTTLRRTDTSMDTPRITHMHTASQHIPHIRTPNQRRVVGGCCLDRDSSRHYLFLIRIRTTGIESMHRRRGWRESVWICGFLVLRENGIGTGTGIGIWTEIGKGKRSRENAFLQISG
jgi:hypothetical protein